MTSYYLPKCCFVRQDGAGRYEVCHTETNPACRHVPSGGIGGFPDSVTPCNRIIGQGQTVRAAVADARDYLGLGY